jgi:hypothetical protein
MTCESPKPRKWYFQAVRGLKNPKRLSAKAKKSVAMRPVRAEAARNIKNAAAGSIYHNKITSVPFTSKDSDDYSKNIIQSGPVSCSTQYATR